MSGVRARDVDVGGGVRIHLKEIGKPSDPPVMFLHGSGPGASGWSNFGPNATVLARAGLRCLVPDILGYGDSDKPTDRPYALAHLAEVMHALLDAVCRPGQQVSIIGNSMGGALATLMALTQPDRVDRLVLMAPGGLEDRDTYLEMRGIRRMMRCLYGPEGLTLDGIRRVFELQVHALEVPEALLRERYEVARTQPLHVFRTLAVPNLADRLPELRCPVLCFWGVEDVFCPVSGAMRVAQSVPDCEVVMLSGCGHWVMVEREALFNARAAEFLVLRG